MIAAALIAFAALVLAAAFAVRSQIAVGRADRLMQAADACQAELQLCKLCLARGAQAAVRRLATGRLICVGEVPEAVLAAFREPSDQLGEALAELCKGGPAFAMPLSEGRAVGTLCGGHPTIFVEASGGQTNAGDEVATRLSELLAQAPHPVWFATARGERLWTNRAYAEMVGATQAAVATASEPLLDANASAQIALAGGASEGTVDADVATVVRGERRLLKLCADHRGGTVAALAVDVTEAQHKLTEHARALESHAATFDKLATAIAIYGPDRRLAFYNAAFQTLWGLPSAFLEQRPREAEVLDRLRTERRLPETADFTAWQRDQLKGHETREGFERWWHLPDGQTLRVVVNPGPDGAMTTIYENVTEQLALERRYNALTRVQSETIDNLGEGIASFGPDGLLRLANPAFWTLSGATQAELGAHVRVVAASAPPEEADVWTMLSERVTGLTDHRTAVSGRLERGDGQVLDYAFSPLADGSTLAAFTDMTDSVNVARALVERNNALVEADLLKNAFIQHVSYELRSPLNTIIGFTQLLTRAQTGPLTERQREYAHYISSSSEALLVIIDGILDLATIDAGIMELDLTEVDVRETVRTVLDGLRARAEEAGVTVALSVADGAETFEGDEQRVRQVMFNLLSNAIQHSPDGGTVTVTAELDGVFVSLRVRDDGPGVAEDKADAVFERFMTDAAGGRRGGVGLGLSLVKSFVELHGGTVGVARGDHPGAEFVVRFPRAAAAGPQNRASGRAGAEIRRAA